MIARATIVAGQQVAITLGNDLSSRLPTNCATRGRRVGAADDRRLGGACSRNVPDNLQSAAAPVVGKATMLSPEAALALCRTGKGGTDQARSHVP